MIGSPHPLLARLWREADAAAGPSRTLRDCEQALAALTADPLAPFSDLAAAAWSLAALDGDAAIAQSLARLRGADAAPAASRAFPGLPPDRERPGRRHNAPPAEVGERLSGTRPALFGTGTEIDAAKADAAGTEPRRPSAPVRDAIPAPAEAMRLAARRPIGGVASAAARRAIELILDGVRPSPAALLAATETAAERPPAPASAPIAARIDGVLTARLSRIDATRGGRISGDPGPAQFEPARPVPPLPPAASGFRRLAALFAQPAGEPASDRFPDAPRAVPVSPIGSPLVPHSMPPDAAAPRLSAPLPVGEDVAAEAEMAELLARVLRREARRQGIADEGGAA